MSQGVGVFGPAGWVFLIALVIAFAALLYWLALTRRLVLRLVAGALALGVGTLFGAGLVNQFYDYYTTWGAVFGALSSSGVSTYHPAYAPHSPDRGAGGTTPVIQRPAPASASSNPSPTESPGTGLAAAPPSVVIDPIDVTASRQAGHGRVMRMEFAGSESGIDRSGYVYLPPQYFEPAYANTKFPVLELFHGDPGDAAGWLYGLRLPQVMDDEIRAGRVGPMVVVMPATFTGGRGQDCVNAPGGLQDDTYLSVDVPADVARAFRVFVPGLHWGVGGLSDGGFCAANLALRHAGRYGAVASMDGFYSVRSDLGVLGKVFGADEPGLRANDPETLVATTPDPLPRFWLMAGTASSADVHAAEDFRAVVTQREPIAMVFVHGGRHTTPSWRTALPSLLEWTWNTISGGPVGTGVTTLSLPR